MKFKYIQFAAMKLTRTKKKKKKPNKSKLKFCKIP